MYLEINIKNFENFKLNIKNVIFFFRIICNNVLIFLFFDFKMCCVGIELIV